MNEESGLTRRSLLVGAGGTAAMLTLGASIQAFGSEDVCRPPGGQDEDTFIARCLRCTKCMEACPQKVLVPAKIETGLLNVRTPTFNFKQGWCDYCEASNDGRPLCAEICPTEALAMPEVASASEIILGTAFVVEDWCLAWQLRGCKICFDACPFNAIELDAHNRPSVLPQQCNGCGLCENVCISMKAGSYISGATDRAITVKPVQAVRDIDPSRAPAMGQQRRIIWRSDEATES